jgi:hypothetical protein
MDCNCNFLKNLQFDPQIFFFFAQLNHFEHELAPASSCLLFFQEMVELKDRKIRKIGGDFEIHLKNLF